jgi:tripartite-type tricarboxylate transporter receptor subunit TctC
MLQVLRLVAMAFLSLLVPCVQATAEHYPDRVVRIINPYPPGGSVDVMARILAQKLTEALGQQVIVENRSGGGGNTGSDFVAKAEPDGYTLLFTAPGPLTINQTLYSKLPFDPAKDFAPIALFATAPIVLIVNPGVSANNVQELIALARREPGKINFASAGNGTRIISPESCSRAWPRSTSCTCRIVVRGRR